MRYGPKPFNPYYLKPMERIISRLFYGIQAYLFIVMSSCMSTPFEDQLLRESYVSNLDSTERDYYVYLPKGYDELDKTWPVVMFLHGDGERGNGKDELPYTRIHGPLYEAWAMKKEFPFIMIVPQLHMFGIDTLGIPYLVNRSTETVPKRLEKGVPERAPWLGGPSIQTSPMVTDFPDELPLFSDGWNRVEDDLIRMLDHTLATYNVDSKRVYLTGLSYGGCGTWYMGSHYPDRFAAIMPVVAWGHPSLLDSIAEHQLPVWAVAGGKDRTVEKKYFYKGMADLQAMGHEHVAFTVHEDLSHDAWKRVYKGDDWYQWLLEFTLDYKH